MYKYSRGKELAFSKHLYVPGAFPTESPLNFITTMRGKYHYSHFKDEAAAVGEGKQLSQSHSASECRVAGVSKLQSLCFSHYASLPLGQKEVFIDQAQGPSTSANLQGMGLQK